MSDENKPRTVLHPLSEAERFAKQWDKGLDENNIPRRLNLTAEEQAAAVPVAPFNPGPPPVAPGGAAPLATETPAAPARARKPLLPEKWAKWAGLAGFLLGLAIFVPAIPTTVGIGLGIGGGLLALLSGGALPQFKFLAHRPLLTGPALAVATTVDGVLGYLVHVMPVGLPMQFCMLASTLCCFLIGKAAPQFTVPTKAAPAETPADPPVGT